MSSCHLFGPGLFLCERVGKRGEKTDRGLPSGVSHFRFFCSPPEQCSPWNRSLDFSCSKHNTMETFNELTVFCFYKYLWPHLPCMERAVSQRGYLEGSKSMKVFYPLWGHGKPRRWPPAGFPPSASQCWVLWSNEVLKALLLIRPLGTECVTALWVCFAAVL